MKITDLDTLGYYEPGFLHLRVNTNDDLSDLKELATNPAKATYFSTFLHEFIHFLQDVSTPSGLMRAHFYIDFIKDVNWSIRHDGKNTFDIPVELNNKNNVLANLKLHEIYRGDGKGPSYVKYDGFIVEEDVVVDKDGEEIRPKKYKVFYYDLHTRKAGSFYFGSVCLKEYMAHAIQKKHFPASHDHPDIPYTIVEQIIAKEYPAFGTDPMMIVAICDASLMALHSAQYFFETLLRMKQESFVPTFPNDVYEFAASGVIFHGKIGLKTVDSLYDRVLKLTLDQYYNALQSPLFLTNYQWIEHILTHARKIRKEHPTFMTQLVTGEKQLSDLFYSIFHLLGTPFFTNNKNHGVFVPPGTLAVLPEQPYQLLIFKQIISLYMGKIPCDLYSFCKTGKKGDITNNNCITAPWLRVKEEYLCPFGQLWKTWGLINEIPVPK